MELKPRFIFHANAAAVGGRIVRPKDIVIETEAASSLTAAGGRSRSKAGKGSFGGLVRFGSASTLAEGLFDDARRWAEALCGDLCEDSLTTTTSVSSEVRDAAVGLKPQFAVRRVNASLVSKSAKGSGEPAIRIGDGTAIEGASIGGHKLIVELNTSLFQRCDTLAKLRTALDDPKFVRENGDCLFVTTAVRGRTVASPAGRLVESGSAIYGTIVKSIRWAGKPYPGAEIDHHVITIPDCMQIFFGEILISCLSRRLTMIRLRLCCPFAGTVMMADSEDNGGWGV